MPPGGLGRFLAAGADGFVTSGGDVQGTIAAGRNIGHWDQYYDYLYAQSRDYDVFAYGSIDAVITANNSSGNPPGGRIGAVGAVGSIAGRIEAEHSIDLVHAGGDVTAVILAPSIGQIAANDAAMAALFPPPAAPPGVAQNVLAEAAAVHAEVLAARAGVAADVVAVLAEFQAAKTAEANALAATEAAVVASNAERLLANQESLDSGKADAEDQFKDRREAAVASLKRAQADAAARLAGRQATVAELAADGKKAYQRWVTRIAGVEDYLTKTADPEMAAELAEMLAASDTERVSRLVEWEQLIAALASSAQEARNALSSGPGKSWDDFWKSDYDGDWLDQIDRFFAGFADVITWGGTTWLRSEIYGTIATHIPHPLAEVDRDKMAALWHSWRERGDSFRPWRATWTRRFGLIRRLLAPCP